MYKIFSHRIFKFLAVFLVINLITQLVLPAVSYALTSGPSQPEVQSFEPVGTTEMVDLFTGDFTYNIPLFELPGPNGGYPFNLHYNSGITMDQESSWTGLGWNLNPGAINRQMRGLPDDFSGDQIQREMDMLPNETIGSGLGGSVELFGADKDKFGIDLSLGVGLYYNNYKGIGYTISPGVNFHNVSKGTEAGIGLNLSMDSQEGTSGHAGLSLTNHGKWSTTSYNVGMGFNSREGITGLSMGMSTKGNGNTRAKTETESAKSSGRGSLSGQSYLSFNTPAYAPQVSMPMKGKHISLSFKVGGELPVGTFGHASINGYINTQSVKNKKSSSKAFGYLNLQKAGTQDVMDVNRDKDGMIRKNSSNLAIPSMTYDIYSVAGQGISGMYRPFRSDVGILHDQEMVSVTSGGALGFEAGAGLFARFGADLNINYSRSRSGKWDSDNAMLGFYQFQDTVGSNLSEPWYFKTYGEHTSDAVGEMAYIGDSLPVRIGIDQSAAKRTLEKKSKPGTVTSIAQPLLSNVNPTETREARNMVIQPITNEDLLNNDNKEILKEYSLSYYASYANANNGISQAFDRSGMKKHHTAGITALNPDGSRYVYGLPAYNKKQVECQFSVNKPAGSCNATVDVSRQSSDSSKVNYKMEGTDQYYNKTTMPEYAHSYLLTSILGPDYIDADNIDGPSTGDIGYWVKFSYVRTSSNYKWRVPFVGANYMEGYKNNGILSDDKGSYLYGEKEVWHLAKAETKSHVAVFTISQRQDGRGAYQELQNASDPLAQRLGDYSYKLDQISLYSRDQYTSTGKPIRNVFFEYSYGLCKNLPNNATVNSGKLTLKKVWFTDENNTRGALNPYVFNYNEDKQPSENPNYNTHKYDRWGNFKPYVNAADSVCQAIDLPYVSQFSSGDGFKTNLDRNMAVWNLKSITLPSGGTIQINYEPDDYGYVQNKVAMQMFNIASLVAGQSTGDILNNGSYLSRRVYFDLETPLPNGLPPTDVQKEMARYDDRSGKIYFKLFVNLLATDQESKDYVSGYADVVRYGIDSNYQNSAGFKRGYVELKKATLKGKLVSYHPFAIATWQHLKTNQPGLMKISNYTPGKGNPKTKAQGLNNTRNDVTKTYSNTNKNANDNGWGSFIDLSKSFIRLNSPDRIKYGGGVRVKEILIRDNWSVVSGDTSDGGIYGQSYDYTIEEGGRTISSGVASYEPLIGGDEIALRRAKGFSEELSVNTANNLYFEYPINENYYPGASVGYRKVKVRSLATRYAGKKGTENDPNNLNIPADASTTGETVHEFYTAKEFPVITDETDMDKKSSDLWIPIPLIGQISSNSLTASQGYSIELNDMHGKLKSVSNYGQDTYGNIIPEPISWVRYNYQCTRVMNGSGDRNDDYFVLYNKVPTITSDKDGVVSKAERLIGVDYDFFTDMRESRTSSTSGGGNFNTDVNPIGIFAAPFPMFWPNVGSATTELRMAVTNKIIHKSGLLISTEAYDGSSMVKTDNKLYDALTGQPLLTSVTNDYDDPVYNYSQPAHMVYDGIGAAYKNIGLRFSATLTAGTDANTYLIDSNATSVKPVYKNLVPGDEFVVNISGTGTEGRKGYYTGLNGGNLVMYIEGSSFAGSKDLILVRSGRRNHLSSMVQNIAALSDPTAGRSVATCNVTVKIPKIQKTYVGIDFPQCAYDLINKMDLYAKSSNFPNVVDIRTYPYNQSGDLCPNINLNWQQYYLSYRSANKAFSTSTTASGAGSSEHFFYDLNYNSIDPVNIQSITNMRYSASTYRPGNISETNWEHALCDITLKNGTTITASLNSEHVWLTINKYKDSIVLADTAITVSTYKINNVLQASAHRLSDNWSLDYSSLRGDYWTPANQDAFASKNSFARGSEGIWREWESYTYAENRKQNSQVSSRTDGTFDNMYLFHFPYPALTCSPKWRKVNTVTDYNAYSRETENKDIQGIYSSALYGYKGGDLVTAVASNARNSEVGFESFEDISTSAGYQYQNGNYGTGNLAFPTATPAGPVNVYNNYTITSGNGNAIITDKPYDTKLGVLSAEVDGVVYFPTSRAGTRIRGTYNISLEQKDPSNVNNTLLLLDAAKFNYGSVKWTGKVKFRLSPSSTTPASGYGAASGIVNNYAHTGKNSFGVYGGWVEHEQKKLLLIPGKKYYYSSWVSVPSMLNYNSFGPQPGYAGLSVTVKFRNAAGTVIQSTILRPSGNIIEKWQKVEGEFMVPSAAVSMVLNLTSGFGTQTAYFDDIRVAPAASGMKTYVYDNGNYRLKAVLDENNYASLYHYDARGNLFLIKKETERGIQTLQETMSHSAEN